MSANLRTNLLGRKVVFHGDSCDRQGTIVSVFIERYGDNADAKYTVELQEGSLEDCYSTRFTLVKRDDEEAS